MAAASATTQVGASARTATNQIEAESLGTVTGDVNVGINVTSTSISAIQVGDYAKYASIDFGSGVSSFTARVIVPATTHQQTIELRLGSTTGTLIGTYVMQNTGSWSTEQTQTISVNGPGGVHDLFFVVPPGGLNSSGAINWFKFTSGGSRMPPPALPWRGQDLRASRIDPPMPVELE